MTKLDVCISSSIQSEKKILTGKYLLTEDWQKELKDAKATATAIKDSMQKTIF